MCIWGERDFTKVVASISIACRKQLNLFANVVLCKSLPGVKTRHEAIDIVVIRENTEGEYSGLEHEGVPGMPCAYS